ncbi:MAG: large conductance mechanosensitive channel protein MscL [Thermomicrobiales bacterium]
MFSEFKSFLLRGNVVDLAVAVVIGAAFGAVVTSLVDNIINPILAAIVGKPDFSDLTISIGDSAIMYGSFITAVINFVIIAAAIFFMVVKPVNAVMSRNKKAEAATTRPCPECLSEIPLAATRCAHCGVQVAAAK